MKATIELDDALYHRLKIFAAQRGRKVKDLVADGVRFVLREQAPTPIESASAKKPAWFGSLRAYAKNAGGHHDLASMRKSVARGRRAAGTK